MTIRRSSKWLSVAAVGFAASAVLGYSVVSAGTATADANRQPQEAPSGVTKDGRTWGPWSDDPEASVPDLVRIRGDHGTIGYADADLVVNGTAHEGRTPEENLRLQEERKNDPPMTIPIYAEDGVTQVDTFTFATGDGFGSEDIPDMPESR